MAEPEISIPEVTAEPEAEYVSSEPESESVPEAEVLTYSEIALWITIYSVWIALIIALNIATIVALVKSRSPLKKLSNMFLLSLIVARTAVAVLVMPARITGLFSNAALGPVLCKLCHYAGSASSVASVVSTCAVAVAKLGEVKYNKNNTSATRALLLVGFIWMIGFLYGLRAYFLNDLVLVNTVAGPIWACTADPRMKTQNQMFIFIDMVVLFIIPLIIIIVCYSKVVKVLHKSLTNQIIFLADKSNVRSEVNLELEKKKLAEQKEKINGIKMLIGVMMAFIICYAAVYAWRLYVFFSHVVRFTNQFLTIEQVVYLISYANPWINVFLYISFRLDIRLNFCTAFRKRDKEPLVVGQRKVKTVIESEPSTAELSISKDE